MVCVKSCELAQYDNVVRITAHPQVFFQVPEPSVSNVDSVEESQHVEKLQQRDDAPVNFAENSLGLNWVSFNVGREIHQRQRFRHDECLASRRSKGPEKAVGAEL